MKTRHAKGSEKTDNKPRIP